MRVDEKFTQYGGQTYTDKILPIVDESTYFIRLASPEGYSKAYEQPHG